MILRRIAPMPISPVPTRRRLLGSGVAVTGISAACSWRVPTVAVPCVPTDRVTVKIESIDCTGEKVVIAANGGEVELARAVRALEHDGEAGKGRGKEPPRHATSDASIIPVPVTWVLSSENRSPTIDLLGSTERLNAIEKEVFCPDPTETPQPNSRLKAKPAGSHEAIEAGGLILEMRIPPDEPKLER